MINKDEEDEEDGDEPEESGQASQNPVCRCNTLGLRFILGGISLFGHRMYMEVKGMK